MTLFSDFYLHIVGDKGLAVRTATAYVDHLNRFSVWFNQTNGQTLDKTNITQTDVREYRQHLQQRRAAPASINVHLAALRSFAAWCGIALTVASVEQQPLAPRWLDRREQAALLREAERAINAANFATRKGLASRDRGIIVLLLNTGLRVSELCALQPIDITVGDRSGQLIVRAGKGSKQRTVALNKEARAALRAIPLPLPLRPRQVQRAIEELGRRAGVKVTPHTLRHTFAKNLADHVPADRVAALLGHANLQTTRRYTTPGERDLQAAVETLE